MTYSFSTTPVYVSEGDYVQFRFKAPPTWDTTQTITIQLGDLTQYWLITTVPEDFTPDPFPFQNYEPAELDTLYTYGDGTRPGESIITVSGLTPTTQAAVALGSTFAGDITYFAMRIDYNGDGNWGRLDGSNNPMPEYGIAANDYWIQGTGAETVQNGSRIQIRGRTQNFNQQNTIITLVIGTANETWRITTKAQPLNIPEPFPNFTNLTGLDLDIDAYSEVIRIQGLTEPATISVDNSAEWAITTVNSTSTNADGFDVLDGVTFQSTPGTVNNGDYLQLKLRTLNVPATDNTTNLTIGDGVNLSQWSVGTGDPPSDAPNGWSFTDQTDVLEDALIASNKMPGGGITGIPVGTSVPVVVVGANTTTTEAKIKINNGSVGVFPASVTFGDQITIYAKSDPNFSQPRTLQIKVGSTTIPTWTIITSSGPDYDAVFTPPNDKFGQVPNTYITSSPVVVTGINRPITIESTGGYDALISIDFDTPVAGPRIFDPAVNSSFTLTVLTADQLGTPEFTNIVVGTEASNVGNVSFTWTVTTYAVAPPPAANLGVWYSNKVKKFDGYSVGTICAILKENVVVGYGDLDGDLNSRYPGFISCDGRALDAALFRELYEVIGTDYGGDVNETFDANGVATYTGTFNVPDYRNRKLAGVGFVDAQRGNSAFLPVSTPGKGIFDVGAEGGYWYFDTVDSAGDLPIEQIEGSGQTGLVSQFFSLGTVRLQGLETIVDDISFTITGSVTALVGPLSEVSVRVPEHEHMYLTAVPESDGGDPLTPFNTSSGTAPRGSLGLADEAELDDSAEIPHSTTGIAARWANFLNLSSGGRFAEEIERYYNSDSWTDLNTWIINNLPTNQTADSGAQITLQTSYMVWWRSPRADSDNLPLQDVSGSGARQTACVDTEPTTFQIDTYTPVSGTTQTHSHMITQDIVGNPQTDFTGGGFSGPGTIGGGYGSGLGGGSASKQVTFDQSELFMDMTEAEFKFSSSFKKPTPDVTMRPQRKVPIINPFHKTKYIIKAF